MSMNGRKPKPDEARRTRHELTHDWVLVVDEPYAGPVPDPGRLPARTRHWWDVVSRMPHCVIWSAGDWEFAVGTAQVHAAWVRTGTTAAASELRQRERLLGLTADARRDLRLRYVSAVAEEDPKAPVSIADRRRELEDWRSDLQE